MGVSVVYEERDASRDVRVKLGEESGLRLSGLLLRRAVRFLCSCILLLW